MTIPDFKTLGNWLWEAACVIRGEVDAPKYKDYILPLIFIKRISDVFEDELDKLAEEYGSREVTEEIVAEDQSLVRIYIPPEARWDYLVTVSTNVGEALTDAVRGITRNNEELSGVIDIVDFNATTAGQRIVSDDQLKALIQVLNKYRLGLEDVEPDILGRAYEYLIGKFAEGAGQSAGEFYTPKEVAILMGKILDPEPGMRVYDPCVGSAGLLIKTWLRYREKYGNQSNLEPVKFYGQEVQPATYALAKMNMLLHDMTDSEIKLANSMKRPAFTNSDSSLAQFDLVTANPMWNQDFEQSVYENDPYNRFQFGYPPNSTADWGWIQHMYQSLNENGKMAVVLDTGAVSRGSGSSNKDREKQIRKAFVDHDLVEAVLLLPENLFVNTSAPGIILVINKAKSHKDEILLINGSKYYEKGTPKNQLTENYASEIASIYLNWEERESISKVVLKEEVLNNDYNISPSRYVQEKTEDKTLPLEESVFMLKEAEEQRQKIDNELDSILNDLGLGNSKV